MILSSAVLSLAIITPVNAANDLEARVSKLEKQLGQVLNELIIVRKERDALREQQNALLEEVAEMQESGYSGEAIKSSPIPSALGIGAYGEHHFNFRQGSDAASNSADQSDIHRFVVFLGYEFNDWISFQSETEIEHGFVADGDGEVSLEQFFFDFNLTDHINARVGRVLHPAGIINRHHEPTTFYGVERPSFSTNVLPSTWSIDGIGLWGSVNDWLSYEGYVHAGLDGEEFKESSGIRSGRMKERPGLQDPGFSGRLDIRPLIAAGYESSADWRVGVSYSHIGAANGNKGTDQGKADADVSIIAFDTDFAWGNWDFRGELAQVNVNNARGLNTRNITENGTSKDVSDEIFGWYIEGAYHILPQSWKTGKFKDSDLVPFVRYGESNTQEGNVPGGGAPDKTDNIDELTVGVSFYPVHNLVLKADYILRDTEGGNTANAMNFGIGYAF